ncbi:MAG TPA: universal stress protein [Clostridia bacterium]|nr:universal stress protein [Clostridia bacterium]
MRILLATDGSRPADLARELVAAMPWPRGTHIRVVSVVPKGADVTARWSEETANLPDVDRLADPAVRTHVVALESAERDLALAHPDAVIERFLLRGRAASSIVQEARDFEADLVVVGHRGHGPIETMLLGSVSAEVVDHAPCPVLVARGSAPGPIGLAEDGSPSGMTAAAVLTRLPFPKTAPITVLTVTDTGFPFASSGAPGLYDQAIESYVRSLDDARAQAKQIAATSAKRLEEAGYRATAFVRDGDPAHEIVEFAKEHRIGLLVLGTRGHTGLRRLLLGSVARNVLLHAPCSVLIIRATVDPHHFVADAEPVGAGAGAGGESAPG